jgi:hypothetical protein
MRFLTGVITGIAATVTAAAWYLSRSGEPFRQRYRIEQRLATLGDELEVRTRDVRSTLDRQLGELRGVSDDEIAVAGTSVDETLDPVAASAAEAEAAAVLEAGIDPHTLDAPATRTRTPKTAAGSETVEG